MHMSKKEGELDDFFRYLASALPIDALSEVQQSGAEQSRKLLPPKCVSQPE